MTYKYAKIGVQGRNHGPFVKNLPGAIFPATEEHGVLSQFISNPEDLPNGLQSGLFVYNPDDQFARFITEKELQQALDVSNHPLGHPVGCLQKAFELFRLEGLEAKDSDPQSSKAAFEDAALVGDCIGSIENGLHRGQFSDDTLKEVEAGE